MFDNFNYESLMKHAKENYLYDIAHPFKHAVIDNAAHENKLDKVLYDFPAPGESWWQYNNEFEKKLAFDKIRIMPEATRDLLIEMNSPQFIEFLENLTGVTGLIPDPYYRGGGCHKIERGGKLAVHSDFNWHPKLKLHRRVNVLLYLNKDWDPKWKGQLELWTNDMKMCAKSIDPIFNRLVVFNSTETSWHGHPHALECPQDVSRKSIATYYYSASPAEASLDAHSTKYQFLPGEEPSEELKEFQKKRATFRES